MILTGLGDCQSGPPVDEDCTISREAGVIFVSYTNVSKTDERYNNPVPAKPGAVRKQRVTKPSLTPELIRGQGRDREKEKLVDLKSRIEKLRKIVTIHSQGNQAERLGVEELCLNRRSVSATPNMALSPKVSTNSSNCWTSGLDLLDDLDLSLFLDSRQMPSPISNNNALRSAQNPSGLFDNELAGIKPDPAATTFDLTNDFAADVNGGELSLDKMGGDVMDMLTSFSDDVDDEYLNSFMDLTGFLLQEDSNTEKPEEVVLQQENEVVENTVNKKSLKRKHDDVESVETESFSASIDHDYVSKKIRTSSVAESETDANDAVVDVTSKSKIAPVQKYRERREKNNIASRRSREIRKQKFMDMELEAERLTVENARLRERITEMEQMAKEMKATLISKLAGK